MNLKKKDYLVLAPLSYCFSIPFFIEFVREMINELGDEVKIDILFFSESEPSMPRLFNHPCINLIEVSKTGKIRYFYFWLKLISLLLNKRYSASYLVSQFSMLLMSIVPSYRCGKIVYLNDEIWEVPKDAIFTKRFIKWVEQRISSQVTAIVTQDKFRGRLVKFVNGNPNVPFIFIPNSRKRGLADRRIISKKLGIDDDTTVLLWSGSVSSGDGCIDVVRLIAQESENLSLILHFRSKNLDEYKSRILQFVDDKKIFYIDREFDYDNLDQLYMSADIGICPYPNRGVNARSIYFASGKINSFLACGVPVITSNYHGLRWISKNGLGVCLKKFPNEITDAVNQINSKKEIFRAKALDFYRANLDASEKWKVLIKDINE